MHRPLGLACVLCVAVVLVARARVQADSISVTSWWLDVLVDGGGHDDGFFYTVQNPFHDSHSASLGQSAAQASYDFDWWDNNGTFHIQTNHQAHDTGGVYHLSVLSSGWIKFTATEDLAFSIDGAYSYYLPAYAMEAGFGFTIRDAQTGQYYFGYGDSDNSVFGAPVSGTFAAQGSGILPAGRQYRFSYVMDLDTHYGASNTFATGSGYVNFQLSPEPASLALLATALLVMPRRRH